MKRSLSKAVHKLREDTWRECRREYYNEYSNQAAFLLRVKERFSKKISELYYHLDRIEYGERKFKTEKEKHEAIRKYNLALQALSLSKSEVGYRMKKLKGDTRLEKQRDWFRRKSEYKQY